MATFEHAREYRVRGRGHGRACQRYDEYSKPSLCVCKLCVSHVCYLVLLLCVCGVCVCGVCCVCVLCVCAVCVACVWRVCVACVWVLCVWRVCAVHSVDCLLAHLVYAPAVAALAHSCRM